MYKLGKKGVFEQVEKKKPADVSGIKALGDKVADLTAKLADEKGRADANADSLAKVIEDFNTEAAKVADLTAKLAELEKPKK